MKALRQSMLALLVLLQVLAPYLHAHAAPTAGAVLHLHLSGGAQAAQVRVGADTLSIARVDTQAGWHDSAALSAAARSARVSEVDVDARSFEMPVEWLRGQPVLPSPMTGAEAIRAPPVTALIDSAPAIDPQPCSSLRFAVLAYPAIAPPYTSSSG